jgi:putative transposase
MKCVFVSAPGSRTNWQFVLLEGEWLSQFEYRLFYRRRLPHIQPPGGTLFITFRLADSIPARVWERLRQESEHIEAILAQISDQQERGQRAYAAQRRLFGQWDSALDSAQSGPMWLRDPRISGLVSESLHYHNRHTYDLNAFCIMPNHVHLVFTPLATPNGEYQAVSVITHSIKRYTARLANRVLERQGQFWQHENYDHVVHDEAEMGRIIAYVRNNPVKAGLIERAEDWEWSYCAHL